MVAKITIGSSLFGALAYNGEKVNEGVGRLLLSNKIYDDGTGKVDMRRTTQEFERYLPRAMRTEKPIIHISLNPHPDDRLSDAEFTDIAAEYMERLGYGEQPYIIFKHEDTGRGHLHIISLRVGKDGKRLNNAYINRRSKRITDNLERKYGLLPSRKMRNRQLAAVKRVDISQGNIKSQIASVLHHAQSYRYQTIGEYRALLSLYGVTVEEARGEALGKEYHGLIYSAIDEKGVKIGKPIKASQFGKYAGIKMLQRHFATSKQQIAERKLHQRTHRAIKGVLSQTHIREKFVAQLKREGVDTIFRETDEGRIYGATFIDHNSGCVLNGSRMGKDISANALEEHFSTPISGFVPTLQSDEPTEQILYQDDDYEFEGLGLFSGFGDNNDENDEENFRRLTQRKRRKKKGIRL